MPKDVPEIEYSKKFLRQFEKLPLKVRQEDGTVVIFAFIGTHAQLYK